MAKPWCIAYRGVDGKLHKEKTEAPTKELTRKLLAKRLEEVTEAKIAGFKVEANPVKFNEFLPDYITHIEACKTSGSIRRDRTSIRQLERVFGGFRLKDVNTGMVQRDVDERMHQKTRYARPPRPATLNHRPLGRRTTGRQRRKSRNRHGSRRRGFSRIIALRSTSEGSLFVWKTLMRAPVYPCSPFLVSPRCRALDPPLRPFPA